MKKKVIVLLSAIMLIGNLCACGDSAPASESGNATVAETGDNEGSKDDENKEESQSSKAEEKGYPEGLAHVYKEDCFGYSINLPSDYNETSGYGYVSHEAYNGELSLTRSEAVYITQYSGEVGDEEQLERIDMSQYEDSTDIFDLLIGNIDDELFSSSYYSLVNTNVEIVETKEINGVEMTKFEGTLTAYHEYVQQECTYPIVAYGIKSSKTPILVSCIDRTEDSSRHEIWVDKIDDVVSTFKDGE